MVLLKVQNVSGFQKARMPENVMGNSDFLIKFCCGVPLLERKTLYRNYNYKYIQLVFCNKSIKCMFAVFVSFIISINQSDSESISLYIDYCCNVWDACGLSNRQCLDWPHRCAVSTV